jgi:aminoglycoside phosphotransferase (APT) family kinase protein
MPGGNTAPVVRVGDTVRRVAGPRTEHVHALMRALRDAGVPYVPEPRGLDDEGREVVEYVAGDVPIYPLPEWAWTDDALCQVARALRRVHDALPDVVCHGDVAPYNTVWRDGRLLAFIDWDLARVGPRGWDLGHAAYRFVSLTAPDNPDGRPGDEAEQRRRLALFCDTYGADADETLEWAGTRVDGLIERGLHRAVYERDAAWIRTLRARSSR